MFALLIALLDDSGNGSITSPFTAWEVRGDEAPGTPAGGKLTFNSDGTVSKTIIGTDDSSVDGTTSWWTPAPTTGIGSSYWVRYTPTVGAFSVNQASTWTALSSSPYCEKSGSASTAQVTFTVEIASDSGGTNIVFTSTGNVIRYQHTL